MFFVEDVSVMILFCLKVHRRQVASKFWCRTCEDSGEVEGNLVTEVARWSMYGM